jgi:hypothetical protein
MLHEKQELLIFLFNIWLLSNVIDKKIDLTSTADATMLKIARVVMFFYKQLVIS